MGTYDELLRSGVDFSVLLKRDENKDDEKTKRIEDIIEAMSEKEENGEAQVAQQLSRSLDPSKLLFGVDPEEEDSAPLLNPPVTVKTINRRLSKSLHSLVDRQGAKRVGEGRSQVSMLTSVENVINGAVSTLTLDDHITVS